MSYVKRLTQRQLINPPRYVYDCMHYETIMGSDAYGVSSDSSDFDVYGFCIPWKNMIFPHIDGYIDGFGKRPNKFENWQEHHVVSKEENREYDFSIYSIIKYFHLCAENNPNMIDSLFTPQRCVLHCSKIGDMVRTNRTRFLSKATFHKFRGYAYSQLNKIRVKHQNAKKLFEFESEYFPGINIYDAEDIFELINDNTHLFQQQLTDWDETWEDYKKYHKIISIITSSEKNDHEDILEEYEKLLYDYIQIKTKRTERVRKYGLDTKFGYHVFRLLDEAHEILSTGNLTLDKKDRREIMKAIRANEWAVDDIVDYFERQQKVLERSYDKSTAIPHSTNWDDIKSLLINCLEEHFGDLSNVIQKDKSTDALINEIDEVLRRYRQNIIQL